MDVSRAFRSGLIVGGVLAVGVALAAAFPPALAIHPLVAAAALLVAFPLAVTGELAALARPVRVAGRLVFYGAVLFASFAAAARTLVLAERPAGIFFAAMLPFGLLLAAALVRGLRRADVDPLLRGEAMLAAAAAPALLAGLSLGTGSGAGAAIVANLAIGFLALGRMTRGLSWRARAPFLEGLALAAVLAGCRVVELSAPAAARAAGVAAICVAAGAIAFVFERRLAAAAPVSAAAPPAR